MLQIRHVFLGERIYAHVACRLSDCLSQRLNYVLLVRIRRQFAVDLNDFLIEVQENRCIEELDVQIVITWQYADDVHREGAVKYNRPVNNRPGGCIGIMRYYLEEDILTFT